jgi:hypothetical protein
MRYRDVRPAMGCRGVRIRKDLAKKTASRCVRAGSRIWSVVMVMRRGSTLSRCTHPRAETPGPGGCSSRADRRPSGAGCRRRASVRPPSPGSRGVASSPTTYRARRRGRWDGDSSERGVGTHENPFRWSRGGLINTLECTGAAAAGKPFVRSLIGLAERCCIVPSAPVRTDAPTACSEPRASGVRTIARKWIGSGLNSFPTPGREGVRFRAVSARFEPFRAVLVRFGPESCGRNADSVPSRRHVIWIAIHGDSNTCLAKQV